MLKGRIKGVGSYLPKRVVTNNELGKLMDTSDEWITKRTGIKERRWVDVPGEGTSDLALQASLAAIEDAKIEKEEIDFIIFATMSADHLLPGSGCFLQAKLGLPGIPTLDIKQQCTGFVYGLSIADLYISTGQYKNILVVGSEVQSKGLDRTTAGRDTAVLFGDGAGAVVVGPTKVKDSKTDSHIMYHDLHTDGQFAKVLWIEAPGSSIDGAADRINSDIVNRNLHLPYMNGKKVYVNAIKRMSEVVVNCFNKNNISKDEVDLYLFHQANLRINEAITEKMDLPKEKVFNTIQKYGNTTAATLPIGMADAKKAGKLKEGDLVLLAAFGSGFTWGGTLIRF